MNCGSSCLRVNVAGSQAGGLSNVSSSILAPAPRRHVMAKRFLDVRTNSQGNWFTTFSGYFSLSSLKKNIERFDDECVRSSSGTIIKQGGQDEFEKAALGDEKEKG